MSTFVSSTNAIMHTDYGDFTVLQINVSGSGGQPASTESSVIIGAIENNVHPLMSLQMIMINNSLNTVYSFLSLLGTTYEGGYRGFKTVRQWDYNSVSSSDPYFKYSKPDGSSSTGLFYGASNTYGYAYPLILHEVNADTYYIAFYFVKGKEVLLNETVELGAGYSPTPPRYILYNDKLSTDGVMFTYDSFVPSEPVDPYDGAGDSGTGGGDGTFDGTSDPVDIPSLPTVGATDAGFITLFAPTSAQLHALASYCWSNLFDIDTFKKLFNDPMDCILGLSVVPVSVPTSGAREITVGNIVTTVQMNVASQQYIEVDCGSISFANKYFGSYLDYEPYTKMAIFLPYCGTHQISADDVMSKTITVKYHIDILTGSCIAFVKCGDSVLYEFNGACASNIPVNSLNYSSTIENAIRIAVNIGTTVATAGASAPLSTATEGASALATAQNIGRGISLAGSTAEGALSMKPSVSRSGAMGGGVGLLGNQTPYIIITRPRLCKPKNQDHFEGYPSFIYSKIEDLIGQGFTSFTDVIISEQFLTDEEENELEAILKGGVYL